MTKKRYSSRSSWKEKVIASVYSVKEWLVEILLVLLVLTLVIWYLVPDEYNNLLLATFEEMFLFFGEIIGGFWKNLLTPTNFILILLVVTLFIVRIRHHIKRKAVISKHCPVCNSEIHRKHRKPLHYFLNLFVPIRVYSCKSCGWEGLRIYKQGHKKQKKSK